MVNVGSEVLPSVPDFLKDYKGDEPVTCFSKPPQLGVFSVTCIVFLKVFNLRSMDSLVSRVIYVSPRGLEVGLREVTVLSFSLEVVFLLNDLFR